MANVRYPGTAGTTPGTITAADVTYDNTTSGLTADDVQEAIDEIEGQIGGLSYDASDISYDNTTSGLTADDVQEAIDEIDSNLNTLDGKVYKTDDSTETTIASDDLLPIYDTSATAAKKITVANMVKATISNPNLLDNPWFTVNQRGQSSYNGNIYTVDRWKASSSETVTINSDKTVSISVGSSNGFFQQFFESDLRDNLLGKTITISAIVNDTLYTTTGTMPSTVQSSYLVASISIGDVELKLRFNASNVLCFYFEHSANSQNTYNIKAVKLEIGSVSTLALDTAPNYATELLKCQRYCVVYSCTSSIAVTDARATNATTIDFYLPMPVSMRAMPTISYPDGVPCAYAGPGVFSDVKIPFDSLSIIFALSASTCNVLGLRGTTSNLTQEKMYKVGYSPNMKLIVSADL